MKTVVDLINRLLEPDLQPRALTNKEVKRMQVVFHLAEDKSEYEALSAYVHDGKMYVELKRLDTCSKTLESTSQVPVELTDS